MIGDSAGGRRTIPILWPKGSRRAEFCLLVFWSRLVGIRWDVNGLVALVLIVLSAFIGVRFVLLQSPKQDKFSYLLYNLWLCFVQVVVSGGTVRTKIRIGKLLLS